MASGVRPHQHVGTRDFQRGKRKMAVSHVQGGAPQVISRVMKNPKLGSKDPKLGYKSLNYS